MKKLAGCAEDEAGDRGGDRHKAPFPRPGGGLPQGGLRRRTGGLGRLRRLRRLHRLRRLRRLRM